VFQLLLFLTLSQVNTCVSITFSSDTVSGNRLPVPFIVWERLMEAYDEYFRRRFRLAEEGLSLYAAREGAFSKIFRWMREAYSCQPLAESADMSYFVQMRWRQAIVQLVFNLKVCMVIFLFFPAILFALHCVFFRIILHFPLSSIPLCILFSLFLLFHSTDHLRMSPTWSRCASRCSRGAVSPK
jgi:hypothetical protein